jgi:hypothetical protein
MRDTVIAFRHELALVEEHCLTLMRMVTEDMQRGHMPRHEVAFSLSRSNRRRVVLSAFFEAVSRRGSTEGSDAEIREAVGKKLVAVLQAQRTRSHHMGDSAADLTDAFEDFLDELGMTEAEFDPDAAPKDF